MSFKCMAGVPVILLLIVSCNPMSVPEPDALCTGIHNSNTGGFCHGAKLRTPEGYCSESNCHGTDLSGGVTGGPSCYSCHSNRWAIWTSHTLSLDGAHHHRDILCSVPGTNIQKCGFDGCHGALLNGGTEYGSGPACTACHGTTPTECADEDD